VPASLDSAKREAARVAPLLRRALAGKTTDGFGTWRRVVLEYRASDEILTLLARGDAAGLALANPLTPDHVIRTKGPHLFLPDLPGDDAELAAHIAADVAAYRARYDRYFAEHEQSAR